MKRWAAKFINGLSLLMCVSAVFLWVRSYYLSDTLRWTGRVLEHSESSKLRILMIYSGQGCIEIAAARGDVEAPRLAEQYLHRFPQGRFRNQASRALSPGGR